MNKRMTFDEWRQLAQNLHARADRLSRSIVERARKVAYEAGLDPSIPFLHAHNALVDYSAGHPWPGVNYKRVRLVKHLEEVSWKPSRLVERILSRAWNRTMKPGETT